MASSSSESRRFAKFKQVALLTFDSVASEARFDTAFEGSSLPARRLAALNESSVAQLKKHFTKAFDVRILVYRL